MRTFTAGQHFTLTQSDMDMLAQIEKAARASKTSGAKNDAQADARIRYLYMTENDVPDVDDSDPIARSGA